MIITLEFACLSLSKPYKAPMKPVFCSFFAAICMLAALTPPAQACLCFRRPTNLERRMRGAKHFPKIRKVSLPPINKKILPPIKEDEPEESSMKYFLKAIFCKR